MVPCHCTERFGATSNFQVDRAPALRDDRQQMHLQRGSPGLAELERFLAQLFLRRYATYCVRRKRYAQAQGAAMLFRELRAA